MTGGPFRYNDVINKKVIENITARAGESIVV
jgi:hypothetical protein